MADEQTINIPQLVVVLVLGGLAIKYFFFSPQNTSARPRAGTVRAREQDVARVLEVFPDADRRSVMWDLQRNGGNVQATCERVTSGRGLEQPPITFQPAMPMPAAASSTSASSSTPAKASQPDLIQRYNLGSKLTREDEEDALPSPSGKQPWSQNKAERQDVMKRRREEMILAARKKMEAKIAAEAATKKA